MIELRDPVEWDLARFDGRCREPDGYEFIYHVRVPDDILIETAMSELMGVLERTGREYTMEGRKSTSGKAADTIRVHVQTRKPLLVF